MTAIDPTSPEFIFDELEEARRHAEEIPGAYSQYTTATGDIIEEMQPDANSSLKVEEKFGPNDVSELAITARTEKIDRAGNRVSYEMQLDPTIYHANETMIATGLVKVHRHNKDGTETVRVSNNPARAMQLFKVIADTTITGGRPKS